MAKKSKKSSVKRSRKSEKKSDFAKDSVAKVMDQMREPLSLLNTLKEEGLANAMALFGLAGAVASGATKNFRIDAMKLPLYELLTSMGFALRDDIEKLEARIEELEIKVSAKEFEEMRGSSDEE